MTVNCSDNGHRSRPKNRAGIYVPPFIPALKDGFPPVADLETDRKKLL